MLGLITMIVLVVLAGWVLYSVNKLTLEQDMIIARLEELEKARAVAAPGVGRIDASAEPLLAPLPAPRPEPR